jgi:hypothetical protein
MRDTHTGTKCQSLNVNYSAGSTGLMIRSPNNLWCRHYILPCQPFFIMYAGECFFCCERSLESVSLPLQCPVDFFRFPHAITVSSVFGSIVLSSVQFHGHTRHTRLPSRLHVQLYTLRELPGLVLSVASGITASYMGVGRNFPRFHIFFHELSCLVTFVFPNALVF